jgi:dynein heavy chain
LIAECNYGGRITDDRDRRLIKVYANEIFVDHLIAPERWRPVGTEEFNYIYPFDEGNTRNPDPNFAANTFMPSVFLEEIQKHFELYDSPSAFGQHTNAEITSQIMDTNELLLSILSLMPAIITEGGDSAEMQTLAIILPIKEGVPDSVDVIALKVKHIKDDSPLTVVLIQEISRFNVLLDIMRLSLEQLEKGIMGISVISPDLEKMMTSLSQNLVPEAWSQAYFSMKSLGSWNNDLKERYSFFSTWAKKGQPFVYHISYFTYPTGFTTSLLQRFSRKLGSPPIDRLEFDFIPTQKAAAEISELVKDGAFITGLYLEGAKWNLEKQCLMEPEIMELIGLMPVIHFKPIPIRKSLTGYYKCPCYYYPIRQGGIGRDSFMLNVDLK